MAPAAAPHPQCYAPPPLSPPSPLPGLLVALFWWVVAAAFRGDHPLSRPLQDFCFGVFARHYASLLLRLRGRTRDQYTQVGLVPE